MSPPGLKSACREIRRRAATRGDQRRQSGNTGSALVKLYYRRARKHRTQEGTRRASPRYPATQTPEAIMAKGIIAWLLGVPLIVIIALYVFHIF